jgi:SAM-dependent methyltransferase
LTRIYRSIERSLPGFLRRYLLFFESAIESSVEHFVSGLTSGARVLDAGAGELTHARYFERNRYVAVDLAVGDSSWDYGKLDAIADLTALPFRAGAFDACVNIVTLEHIREPGCALREIERTLAPGGQLLLIAPHEWEVHQSPHDYYRYTRHGLAYLFDTAGFSEYTIEPVGGYFRLMSRRLLNGLQFFPGPWFFGAAIFLVPLALVMPWFDSLDRERNFTLGYICIAKKRS